MPETKTAAEAAVFVEPDRRIVTAQVQGKTPAATPRAASPGDLEPGEFLWHPEIAPTGPVVLVVSLD